MKRLAELLTQRRLAEGLTPSALENVSFFKTARPVPRSPLIYEPGIYVVAQGAKYGYLGDRRFRYDADNYLVVSVATPFECEACASPEDPVTGIHLAMDIPMLHELALGLDQAPPSGRSPNERSPSGLGAARMTPELANAVLRLATFLESDLEAVLLGPGAVREIYYRVLMGGHGHSLFALLNHNSNFSRIAATLKVIHTHYMRKLDVEQLADAANMSPSSFHKAFKEVTTDSPLQYLKKVRLNKARELLLQERTKAYIAAERVGYESQSQFSREFKRYFGQGPADMLRDMREAVAAPDRAAMGMP